MSGSEVVGPLFLGKMRSQFQTSWVNIILGLILLVLVVLVLRPGTEKRAREFNELYQKLKSEGLNYGNLTRLISVGGKKQVGIGPKEIIQNMNLSEEAADYFSQLIDQCEGSEYSELEVSSGSLNEEFFKELKKVCLS